MNMDVEEARREDRIAEIDQPTFEADGFRRTRARLRDPSVLDDEQRMGISSTGVKRRCAVNSGFHEESDEAYRSRRDVGQLLPPEKRSVERRIVATGFNLQAIREHIVRCIRGRTNASAAARTIGESL